eukprot:TRINITY_DN15632_c0_g1_i1.p1 TRINITY_DN15632_c0_g1~~TRINITY_DN15632_c0_g1_i1.p1  ORF type:complete len:298 (-),score=39.29 TRINITY_DN15632_c0_g1_i1:117-1010(-)
MLSFSTLRMGRVLRIHQFTAVSQRTNVANCQQGLLRASRRVLGAGRGVGSGSGVGSGGGEHEGPIFDHPQMFSGGRVDHLHTPDNTRMTPFEFSDWNYDRIAKQFRKYPSARRSAGVIPLLHFVQEQEGGWISLAAMDKVAKICGVTAMQVYEVASFYSQFNRQPIGGFLVQVCITTPCMLCGSDELAHELEKELGIHMGQTTPNGMVTLGEFECLGACVNAPMMQVSDWRDPSNFSHDFYEDLTLERGREIVRALANGEKPPHGPQNGRKNCCPVGGPTTLLEKPPGPFCRDLSQC